VPEFEVIHGSAGRGLVRDGPQVFTVPEALARELALAGDDAPRRWRELVGEARGRRPSSPVWLRVVLVPAAAADRATRWLSPLAGNAALACLAVAGVSGLAAGVLGGAAATAPGSASAIATGTGLFVLTALWHEFGHAAALRREGLPAGRIGAGLLWVLPVLTCDVTAAALLPRAGRMRVDVAGMVFQFAAAGALAAVATVWPPAGHGAAGALAAVAWNIVPLLRTDGHWLLLDLLGLPDLDAPPPPAWSGCRLRVAGLVSWRVVTALSVLALVVWLPVRADGWLGTLGARTLPAPAIAALRGLAWLVAVVGGWRALRRARVLLAAVARDLTLTPSRR
jgi:putative peptide zinc metalloprotease protein